MVDSHEPPTAGGAGGFLLTAPHPLRPSTRYIASDGTPEYAIWAEQYLVGSAMLAPASDVPVRAVARQDFHDDSLGIVWAAITELATGEVDPTLPRTAHLLEQWGELDNVGAESRLADLACSQPAMVYASVSAMTAHAALIREWGEKRRRIAGLSLEVRAAYTTRPLTSLYSRPEYQDAGI